MSRTRTRRARGNEDDRGNVTVEAAIGLCTLAVVFGIVLAGVAAVVDHFRCLDAAAGAVRLLARGVPESEARQLVDTIAPDDSTFSVSRSGEVIAVTVSTRPFIGVALDLTVDGEAHARLEPGVEGGPVRAEP